MAILHPTNGATRPAADKSSRQHKDIGSGSRPTKSTHKIETSAPHHPHLDKSRGSHGIAGKALK